MSNSNNNNQYYHYDPSVPAAAIFLVLFFIVTVIHFFQLIRSRTLYFIPFVVGGCFEWIGYGARIFSAKQTPNWQKGPFIAQDVLLLLAPALFCASIYMTLGRIILVTDAEHYSPIRKKWLTKIFVCGDILSFLTQGFGGGLEASQNSNTTNTGKNVIVVGLGLQLISFGYFMIVSMIFRRRLNKAPTAASTSGIPWRKHMNVLFIAGILIFIRSVFRVVEFAGGPNDYIQAHEVFMYIFDSCLMFPLMVMFAVVHPGEINALLRKRKFEDVEPARKWPN